jgi:D-inositol-3-phosphate glycosyltransferase
MPVVSALRVFYSFPDTLGKAGIGLAAFQEAQGLIGEGDELTLACTSISPGRALEGAREELRTLELAGRRIPHRTLGISRAYRFHDRRAARRLARLGARFDVVHTWPRGVLRTAAVAHRLGIPVVREAPNTHTAHAYEVVAREYERLGLAPPPGHSHSFDAAVLALEEAEYAAADLLLVPSELARQTFLERGFSEDKLALHRYGYDPELLRPGSAHPLEGRPLTVLFAARCEPRKGLHLALRAWHDSGLAESGRLIVLGEFVPDYRQLVEPLLAHPSVEWRGFVPEIERVMQESDILLLPSIEEGSALVTYLAQGSGCVPIVSEAAGAHCEHLQDALVHAPGDVATLTEHLRMVDRDRALLGRLREATLRRAPTLTWQRAARELHETYERLLERWRGARPQLAAPPSPGQPISGS